MLDSKYAGKYNPERTPTRPQETTQYKLQDITSGRCNKGCNPTTGKTRTQSRLSRIGDDRVHVLIMRYGRVYYVLPSFAQNMPYRYATFLPPISFMCIIIQPFTLLNPRQNYKTMPATPMAAPRTKAIPAEYQVGGTAAPD